MMMEIGAEIAEEYLFKYSGGNSGVICLEPVDTGSFSCLRGVLPGQVHLCTVSLYTDLLLFGLKNFVSATLISSFTQQQTWAGTKACSTGQNWPKV